jgi:predicted metalloprotease with PDZ domain
MPTHYAIRPADPAAHLFHVTCRVDRPDPAGQLFMLPAWIPGSYMIREFARNIVRITALAGGRKLALEKLDKHTWRAAPARGPVELAYEVYAWDLSVRAAHLDESHGFFNGTSVFLLPMGLEHEPCTVDLLPPAGTRCAGWKVATGLSPARGTRRLGFGTYQAANYDELIDCPVEMGTFELGRFEVLGVPHEVAVTGRVPKLDMDRLTADLAQENYTRLLWAFEGFTSYYDDLMLVRSGLLTEPQYLETLAKTFTTVLQRTSRLKQSVADSSFDAWIKYYRQDENAPNSVVSYYQKGSLVGLALDLTLRAETKGRVSLDDAMRALWRRARDGGAGYAGVGEDEFVEVTEQVSGLALERRLREWTEGTRDPDFAALLAPLGIQFAARPAVDAPHFALLGVKTATSGTDCKLAHVFDGSPARQAGLSANDVLVALGGLRVTPSNLDGLLMRYAAGEVVECLAFRRDELLRFEVKLATQPPLKVTLTAEDKAPKAAQRLKAGWLGRR